MRFGTTRDLNESLASKNDIDAFDDAWHAIDCEDSGYIAAESIPALVLSLERPLRPPARVALLSVLVLFLVK